MDEVKIQRNGLFTHLASKMFHMKLSEEKYSMITLLKEIPELSSLFKRMKGNLPLLPISLHKETLHIEQAVLNHYHMTKDRFINLAAEKWRLPIDLENITEEDRLIKLGMREPINKNKESLLPFRYDYRLDTYTLSLQKDMPSQLLPDMLIMYLLLYNLSMISRYEIDWWTELFKEMGHQDLPFISGFLDIAEFKIPILVGEWLTGKEV